MKETNIDGLESWNNSAWFAAWLDLARGEKTAV
jgi:hypothetical protein